MSKEKVNVESWGTGRQDYTAPPPTPGEKKMFIVGIAVGAVLSFLGSYVVTAMFRMYDYGYSIDNIIFFVVPLFFFILLFKMIPSIIKKL